MIVEGIFNVLFLVVDLLFSHLPDLEWTVEADMFTKFFEVLRTVCYFLPMETVGRILVLIVAINIFKIVIAFIKLLCQFIPFM